MLALPLAEFSVKSRDGGPNDDEDAQWPIWAGHVPMRGRGGHPIPPEPGQRTGAAIPELPAGTTAVTDLRSLSLWWDTLGDVPAPRPPLDGDLDVDVAIVGAGYTGLWTAYYLTRAAPGTRIAIVEANVAGFGASGRNGGWCSALFPASLDRIARSELAAGRPGDAARDARHRRRGRPGRRAPRDWTSTGPRAAPWAWPGRPSSWTGPARRSRTGAPGASAPATTGCWRPTRPSERAGATSVLGATYTPHCAAIHPAKLARGLAGLVEAAGVRIYEGTPATSIEPGVVRTPLGDVRAPHVVRATEGFTAQLPGHRRTVLPVYSLMLATEPLPEEVWDRIGLAARETFNDGRHLIIYGQRTADGRLAFGGRGAPYHFGSRIDPAHDRAPGVHEGLWQTLTEMFPAVAPFRVTHRWGGPLGISRDWYASCGLDRRTGLAWAGGYVGDGVGTSNLAGRTLADLITGTASELTSLPWVNHRSRRWEPEPLRWLGANGGLAVMTSADAAEARSGRPARRAAAVRAVPRSLRIPRRGAPRIESGQRQDHDCSRGHHRR